MVSKDHFSTRLFRSVHMYLKSHPSSSKIYLLPSSPFLPSSKKTPYLHSCTPFPPPNQLIHRRISSLRMNNGGRKEFLSPCLNGFLRGRKLKAFVNAGQVISAPNSLKGGVDLNNVRSLFYLTNIVCHRYYSLPLDRLHFYMISEPTGSDSVCRVKQCFHL